jgi:hypothetical protein
MLHSWIIFSTGFQCQDITGSLAGVALVAMDPAVLAALAELDKQRYAAQMAALATSKVVYRLWFS